MMATRVNINIPDGLYKSSQKLIKKGLYANFSEIIRDALRKSLIEYNSLRFMEEKFLEKLKKEKLLTESEMEKYGLKLH